MSLTDEGHYGPKKLNLLKVVWGEGFLSPDGTEEIDEIIKNTNFVGKTVLLGKYGYLTGVAVTSLLIYFFYSLGFKEDIFIELVTIFHTLIVNYLYLLIGIHIITAIYHRLKKDGF